MLLTAVILYVLLALMVMLLQRRMIYFPTTLAADLALQHAAEEGFLAWRNKAGEIIGWRLPANAPATGAVLILHGNAGCAIQRNYLAQPIHAAAPVDVFVLEYPGYGARGGSPSLRSFLAAGEDAFDALPTNRPVYIVAESLGAGVASHLAKTYASRVSGLLFFAPYNDLAAVGQRQMPFLPVKLLMWDRFAPSEWLKDYRGPLVVVVGESDTIIPPPFARRLHDDYGGRKRLQAIPGAGHNDIAAQSVDWWREAFAFWASGAR